MAMSIRTNVASLNAQRALFNAGNDLSKSMQRLSTGFRINSSSDDAAGLAISTKLQSQIGGLNQASMNAQDGISMIQTAEGALDEITASFQRMRDLGVQAANSTLSDADRGNINTEIQALFTNINNISSRTEFNGQKLLTGALTTSQSTSSTVLTGLALAASTSNPAVSSVTAIDVKGAAAGTTFTLTGNTTAGTLTMAIGTNAGQSIAVNTLTAGQSQTLDFSQFGVKITVASSGTQQAGDTTVGLNGLNVQTATGSASAAFQVGANANQIESAAFFNTQVNGTNATVDGLGATIFQTLNTSIAAFNAPTGHTILNAQTLIGSVDNVIASLVNSRAALGASQNSLSHTMANLRLTSDNLSASNSRIRDVDVAAESSAMTRAQIISQSSVSVLAQANQMPQLALKLLG
jgi:flagellin